MVCEFPNFLVVQTIIKVSFLRKSRTSNHKTIILIFHRYFEDYLRIFLNDNEENNRIYKKIKNYI